MKTVVMPAVLLLATAVAAPLGAGPMGEHITVRVVNSHAYDHPVEMYDNVCKRVVFSQRIVGHATLNAQVCAFDMGKGDVTLRNLQTGAQQHYKGFVDNAKLEVP